MAAAGGGIGVLGMNPSAGVRGSSAAAVELGNWKRPSASGSISRGASELWPCLRADGWVGRCVCVWTRQGRERGGIVEIESTNGCATAPQHRGTHRTIKSSQGLIPARSSAALTRSM